MVRYKYKLLFMIFEYSNSDPVNLEDETPLFGGWGKDKYVPPQRDGEENDEDESKKAEDELLEDDSTLEAKAKSDEMVTDEKGNIIDGDQIIAALAKRWKSKKMLKGGVVGTLMSNYGLEKFFKTEKIKFIRANVGDRYVKEKMQKNKFNLGGEQSGHIILGKFATTGDGLLVALEALFAIRKGKKASTFFNKFKKTPQILKNIEVKNKDIINYPDIKKSIKIAEKLIKGQGRILVRKSGTESKIRVMGESENKELLKKCVDLISRKIK